MKFFLIILLTYLNLHAAIFGETKEEQRNAEERLRLAFTGRVNPLINIIKKENQNLKKILTNHNIHYRNIIKRKKRNGTINNIKNYFLVTEKKEIETLKQINKELKRLLSINNIQYSIPKRDFRTRKEKEQEIKKNIEHIKAKEKLRKELLKREYKINCVNLKN